MIVRKFLQYSLTSVVEDLPSKKTENRNEPSHQLDISTLFLMNAIDFQLKEKAAV